MEIKKGTKVRHRTKGMEETIVGTCKIKLLGTWVDGVIYEGVDTNTGQPATFVRTKTDFIDNFMEIPPYVEGQLECINCVHNSNCEEISDHCEANFILDDKVVHLLSKEDFPC